jgi:hypothetical protein
MSIRDEINNRLIEARLFLLPPALSTAPSVRTLLITPTIRKVVLGPWADPKFAVRAGRLRADLDAFSEGFVLSVATDPFRKPRSTFMARLDKPDDEVWEIRSRDPKPGIRVFGRFAEKDVFIAINWATRETLGGPKSRGWRDAIETCKAEWRNLMITYPPATGDDPNDYITNIILV